MPQRSSVPQEIKTDWQYGIDNENRAALQVFAQRMKSKTAEKNDLLCVAIRRRIYIVGDEMSLLRKHLNEGAAG